MHRLARRLSSSSAILSISTRGRSCTQCRRCSVPASADSDTSPQRRGGRKMSKNERRSLVESFVNKYKVMNSGKFPTVSHVTSVVGGSYYVVKKIVQQLQHESPAPSAGMSINNLRDEIVKKENQPLSSSAEDSSGQMAVGEEISVDTRIGTSLGNEVRKCKPLNADQVPSSKDIGSNFADDVYMRDLEREIEREGEVTELVYGIREEARSDTQLLGNAVSKNIASLQEVSKEDSSSKDNGPAETTKEVPVSEERHEIMPSTSKISLNESEELTNTKYVPELGVEPKYYQEESAQVGEFTSDLKKNEEPERKSIAWKHLKSLADGIMRIWRKL